MYKQVATAVALLATPIAVASGCANQSSTNPSGTSTTTSGASSAKSLTAQLNTTDGKHVADATVDFSNGYATVTVETVGTGNLSPGFHGVHLHAIGKCEGDFSSAGEHFQASGHTGQPASGDLPPLLVRSDGSGKIVATSDGFTEDELKGAEGSSIVLHQAADMGGNAGDQRIACGVLSPAQSATSSSVSTSVSTSTVTTTAVPPATVIETSPSPSEATTTSSSASPTASTSTSTVTVIQPTLPAITVPNLPGPNGG